VHFTGGAVFISNVELSTTPLIQALKSRCHSHHHNPSNDQLAALMRNIAAKGESLTPEEGAEVVSFILAESERIGSRLDVRLFQKGGGDYRLWKEGKSESNWQVLVGEAIRQNAHTVFGIHDDRVIVEALAKEGTPTSEQAREFAAITGKSERTFYRYKA